MDVPKEWTMLSLYYFSVLSLTHFKIWIQHEGTKIKCTQFTFQLISYVDLSTYINAEFFTGSYWTEVHLRLSDLLIMDKFAVIS